MRTTFFLPAMGFVLFQLSSFFSVATAQTCTLTPSGKITATSNGQVIQNLAITSTSGDAITVNGYSDVVIKNVLIKHQGGQGIKFTNAPRLRIENAEITYTGAPAKGKNPGEFNNINGYGSTDVIINNVKLTRGSTGIYMVQCPGAQLSFIEGYDFRGPFPRGQIVQFGSCNNSTLSDFYNRNPIDSSWTEDNVNIYESSNVTIRRGLIDGNNSPSGVGVIFEPRNVATAGLVEDVDAIRMGNGAFSVYSATSDGSACIFRRVRSRDNICGDLGGRGNSMSNSLMFASGNGAKNTQYEQAQYFNSCNGNIAWDQNTMAVKEFTKVDFQLRAPVKLTFCWNSVATGISDNQTDNSVQVWCDRFTQSVTLDFSGFKGAGGDLHLFVYDLMGKAVASYSPMAGTSLTFEKDRLPPGIYIYKVILNETILSSGKLMMQ